MSTAPDPILQSAMSLPSDQRAALAVQLLQSLPYPGKEVSSLEYSNELRQRVEDFRMGEIAGADLDEARQRIEKKLSAGSSS